MDSESVSVDLTQFTVPGSNYGYTGLPINQIQSFKNTLAIGLLDESGSTDAYKRPMELAVKEVVKSLQDSPEADQLMYRQCHFATGFREHHGFMPLVQINLDQYDGCYISNGQTTLYDSIVRVIHETLDYAKRQSASRYLCNAIIYIITDGRDYGSILKQADVKKALEEAIACEELESLFTVLIGVNDKIDIQQDLEAFQKNVGITKYIPLKDASQKSLSRLTNWLSQQISSQSQQVGSGQPSQSLTF